MEKTSVTLIKRVQNGEEEAFNELFQLQYKNVYYSAYRICRSDDDAKEISQQTFIQVYHSIKNLNDPNTFEVWLHRIVVNKCYNLFAKRKDTIIDPETSAMMKNEEERRKYLMPKEASRHQSDMDVLNMFLDELPEKYRVLLVLAYFQEHTMEEVADIMNLPVGTVKSRLSTARGLLKKKINEYEKMENISLNFHELTPLWLGAAFFSAYQNKQISIPLLLDILPVCETGAFFSFHKLYKGAIFTLSTILVCCGIQIFQSYFNEQNNRSPYSVMNYLDQEIAFEPVTLDDITYFTPQEAYYSLLVYAHCEVELNAMTKEELYHFKPLYDALKRSNGSYYRRLQDIGWEGTYQKLL